MYNFQIFWKLKKLIHSDNIEILKETIHTEQAYLDKVVQDWAFWDDTYKFIQDGNQEYITQQHTKSNFYTNRS